MKALVMRAPGTNCDSEMVRALKTVGFDAPLVHINDVLREKNLSRYDVLVFPGGFSYGDYIRSGAIWGKKFVAVLKDELRDFVAAKKPIVGVCNGMQVLVEAGLIPRTADYPEAAMASNSLGYRCMWTWLRVEKNVCGIAGLYKKGEVLRVPIAHGEGRYTVAPGTEKKALAELEGNEQIVFRYCKPDGSPAGGEYPWNPNGSLSDIAGICNPEGNVLAMMPHPERASFFWQFPDWTLGEKREDGLRLFKGLAGSAGGKSGRSI
ncbi:Phosphoribosylformylglycinamidine synthase subunit PurQ [Candidatus Norongarragalina meridionalis]|nr:Phosphoribosylformylglycinamidine synthase subunit PurQ [Candidatus Norongarragalina meridionalis]